MTRPVATLGTAASSRRRMWPDKRPGQPRTSDLSQTKHTNRCVSLSLSVSLSLRLSVCLSVPILVFCAPGYCGAGAGGGGRTRAIRSYVGRTQICPQSIMQTHPDFCCWSRSLCLGQKPCSANALVRARVEQDNGEAAPALCNGENVLRLIAVSSVGKRRPAAVCVCPAVAGHEGASGRRVAAAPDDHPSGSAGIPYVNCLRLQSLNGDGTDGLLLLVSQPRCCLVGVG